MPLTVAQLVMQIEAKGADKAKAAIKGVNDETDKAPSFFQRAASSALGFAAGAIGIASVGGAWDLLTSQVHGFMEAGKQAQQMDAQTQAVLKSTGGAAGVTADAVHNIAQRLSDMSGADDQAIQSSENMLLTFTKIGKDVFPRASQAALDMATSLNHGAIPSADQMSQVSIMLGKALNDPQKGMTALQRVGVTFDESQKKLIATYMKHGEVAKAQGVILAELSKEFGGSAQAAGGTYAGAVAKLGVSWQHIQENIGTRLLPRLAALLNSIMPLVVAVGENLPGAIDTATAVVANISAGIGTFVGWLNAAKGWVIGVGSAITAFFLPALIEVGVSAATAGATLVTAFVAGLIETAVASGTTAVASIGELITSMVAAHGQALVTAGAFVGSLIPGVLSTSASFVTMAVTGVASAITGFIAYIPVALAAAAATIAATWPIILIVAGVALLVGGIILLVTHWKQVTAFLQGVWSAVVAAVQAGFKALVSGAAALFEGIGQFIGGVIEWFLTLNTRTGELVLDLVTKVLGFFAGLGQKALQLIQTMIQLWIDVYIRFPIRVLALVADFVIRVVSFLLSLRDQALAKARELVTGFLTQMAVLPSRMLQAGADIISGLVNGLAANAGRVLDFVKNLAGNVLSSIKSVFGIASPSKAMHEIGGHLATGLINGFKAGNVHHHIAKHLSTLPKHVAAALGGSALGAGGGSASAVGGSGNPIVDAIRTAQDAIVAAIEASGVKRRAQAATHHAARMAAHHTTHALHRAATHAAHHVGHHAAHHVAHHHGTHHHTHHGGTHHHHGTHHHAHHGGTHHHHAAAHHHAAGLSGTALRRQVATDVASILTGPGGALGGGSSTGQNVTIQLVLDNRVIGTALMPYIVQAIKRAGVKLS